jgi:uncharacterized protein (DUF2267 family)
MAELDLPIIDKTVHKTRLWLDDVMAATETMDRARAYRALRAVLHALRDNLDVEGAARFAAQMPLLVRGLYYEGWRPGAAARRCAKAADFVGLVAAEFGDFPTMDLERVCRGVFRVLRTFVSAGEMSAVVQALAPEVRRLLEDENYRERGATLT